VDAVFVPKIIIAFPIFMMAGYFGPHFSPSKASSMYEKGVSLSTASSMDTQGVSFSKASRIDVQGVSPSTTSSMDMQDVPPFTTSSENVLGVFQSFGSSLHFQNQQNGLAGGIPFKRQ
jgi:hypothetical protein